ncbi:aminopeptidase P family protein [bacterium]|nr:MAG: aminopeptidase P family protein [bacterium]
MLHLHRKKLVSLFDQSIPSVIFLQSGKIGYKYNTDTELPFRQESNFIYLTGVTEPDFACAIDVQTGEYTLFSPQRDTQYAVWHGYITPQETYKKQYEPDVIAFDSDIETYLKKKNPKVVYCLTDAQAAFIQNLGYQANSESLIPALTDCRVNKSEWELEKMRMANKITSEAHSLVMREAKAGMKEYHIKGMFESVGFPYNVYEQAYNGIYAAGKNAAILHYQGRESELKAGELFLVDAGMEYQGYAGDITRTFPVSARFTDAQAGLYQACLNAHNACIKAVKPGVKMEDLHLMAALLILEGLREMGLVKGDVDELMDANIFALFFPHGLGHMLGLDTHDVGGYKKGVERIDRPGIRFLRARRELEPGMVVTIEPGVYLIPALLQPAFDDFKYKKYLVKERILPIMDIGGIRIEDNIIATENGYENLSSVPKTIEEIEHERS